MCKNPHLAVVLVLLGATAAPGLAQQKKLNSPVMQPAFAPPAAVKSIPLPRSSAPSLGFTMLQLPRASDLVRGNTFQTPSYQPTTFNNPFVLNSTPWSPSPSVGPGYLTNNPWTSPSFSPSPWNVNPWNAPLTNGWNNQLVNYPNWGLNGGGFPNSPYPAWGNPYAAGSNGLNLGLPPLAATYGYSNPLAPLFQSAFPGFGLIR
jgi:hypothetical protein